MTETTEEIQQEPTEITLSYLNGEAKAPTAEALMRARYSSYKTGNINFLRDSLSEEQRKDFSYESTEKWSKSAKWIGLEIIHTEAGLEEDEEGLVEFKAFFEQDGKPYEHHEKAIFSKTNGEWLYVGSLPMQKTVKYETPKVGRNDPCPCGSGKKYKKCCA
jgi:SEC-C motif-containing protein